MDGYFITQNERSIRFRKKKDMETIVYWILSPCGCRYCFTNDTPFMQKAKKYWTGSKELVGIVEKVMNDGSIGSTFNEGHLTVEGEDAYCIDINTDFRNGYKTRADASTRISADQIS